MVRAGISLPALQHLMGHSRIHTTMLLTAALGKLCEGTISFASRSVPQIAVEGYAVVFSATRSVLVPTPGTICCGAQLVPLNAEYQIR